MVLSSCKNEDEAVVFDMEKTPVQSIGDMSVVQSEKGSITMRMTAPLMQSFEFVKDGRQQSYDYYPEGIKVRAYTLDGALETVVVADEAKHVTTPGEDTWMAFGNVVVKNVIKDETMESDTIYWNQSGKRIYTDCYVRLSSPSGFMQGYGMVSDERARNSEILNPFDSYSKTEDSTSVWRDSVNFVGPMKQPFTIKDSVLKEF